MFGCWEKLNTKLGVHAFSSVEFSGTKRTSGHYNNENLLYFSSFHNNYQ
jgi:hypothetical protein